MPEKMPLQNNCIENLSSFYFLCHQSANTLHFVLFTFNFLCVSTSINTNYLINEAYFQKKSSKQLVLAWWSTKIMGFVLMLCMQFFLGIQTEVTFCNIKFIILKFSFTCTKTIPLILFIFFFTSFSVFFL